MKKTLSVILAVVLAAAMTLLIPLSSFAKEEAGDPKPVGDAAAFAAMETGGSYYLTANITVQYAGCVATDAVTQAEYFDQMKKQVADTHMSTK